MIKEIRLTQFRNFVDQTFSDIQSATVISGPNGTGKTNILEAIAFMGGRRFVKNTSELIHFENDYARIACTVMHPRQHTLAAAIVPSYIEFQKDGVACDSNVIQEYFPAVYFSPQTVGLLNASPSQRRRFMDHILSVISPQYVVALSEYRQALKQRNAALKRRYTTQLAVWENTLASTAADIVIARSRFLYNLSKSMGEQRDLVYVPSPRSVLEIINPDIVGEENSGIHRNIVLLYLEKYEKLRPQELELGFSVIGPQRDDWLSFGCFEKGGVLFDVGKYGSRGQQRIMVVDIQKGVLSLLSSSIETTPIWLLDDVFSELDRKNQREVLALMQNYQVFVTTTNIEYYGIDALLNNTNTGHIILGDK